MTKNPSAGKSLTRKQGVALYNGDNNVVTLVLQRGNLYRGLALHLQAALTMSSGAANTVAATAKGDEWAIISRVRIVANNTDAVVDLTGDDLWMLNRDGYGCRPRITPTLGDGASATVTVDSLLHIPLWMLRARKPMDTALESWNFTNLQIEITFRTFTLVSSAATAYATAPQVTVYTNELMPAFQPDGTTLKFRPAFYGRTFHQYQDFAAAQTQGKVLLDAAPYHPWILINVQANGGGADLINTLTNVKLFDGPRLVRDFAGTALLSYGEVAQSLDPGIEIDSTNIARNTRERISQSSDPRAWYKLTLCDDGLMSEAPGGMNTGDFYMEVQTSAACRIVLIDRQIITNPYL